MLFVAERVLVGRIETVPNRGIKIAHLPVQHGQATAATDCDLVRRPIGLAIEARRLLRTSGARPELATNPAVLAINCSVNPITIIFVLLNQVASVKRGNHSEFGARAGVETDPAIRSVVNRRTSVRRSNPVSGVSYVNKAKGEHESDSGLLEHLKLR